MSFEWAFNTLWGLVISGLWMYVNTISKRFEQVLQHDEKMKESISRIMVDYQTRRDSEYQTAQLIKTLDRIENKVDRLTEEVHKKADK